jgi:hypothetical protein
MGAMRRAPVALAALAAAALACHSGPDCTCGPGLTCADSPEGGVCMTPPMQPMTRHPGPTLANMEVWICVWDGDEAFGQDVNLFVSRLFASDYYRTNMAEYGASGGVSKGVLRLGAPPASSDFSRYEAAIASLPGKMTYAGETFDAPNENTVVLFVVPGQTMTDEGIYHYETAPGVVQAAMHVPYIVLPRNLIGPDFDELTWSASHEIVEVASDPHPTTFPAWYDNLLTYLGEIADLCNDIPTTQTLDGTPYVLTRIYSASRAAARAGDPCVPALDRPFAGVALSPLSLAIPENGSLRVGTLEVHAFSYGPPSPMTWYIDFYPTNVYSAAPATGTIVPGESVSIVVTRDADPGFELPVFARVALYDPADPFARIPVQEAFGAVLTFTGR